MKALGWAYDENETHTINGVVTDWGFVLPKDRKGDI
jgi:Mg2+/Co2+ transporter CorB